MRSQLWKKLLDVETLKASKIFNYKVKVQCILIFEFRESSLDFIQLLVD